MWRPPGWFHGGEGTGGGFMRGLVQWSWAGLGLLGPLHGYAIDDQRRDTIQQNENCLKYTFIWHFSFQSDF